MIPLLLLSAYLACMVPAAVILHRENRRQDEHLFPALQWDGDDGLCLLGAIVWPLAIPVIFTLPGHQHTDQCKHRR